jgi:putative ABC transport system ATP-binding protein
MSRPPPLLSLVAVGRTYKLADLSVDAVREVSLDICHGESLAVMGPSGSGKSTLMNMIGLLDLPTKGSIRLEGTDVASLSEDQRSNLRARTIGFVFQSYNLLPRHNALENVALPLLYCGVARKEREKRAELSLQTVGMAHRARHYPRQLSGGEQQRIAIARALVSRPLIVLADEPTGALDSTTGAGIVRLLCSLNDAGQTVVLITHDPDVARHCRRTVRLNDGQVVADNRPAPSFVSRRLR